MTTQWRWSAVSSHSGMCTDKVFIATSLVVSKHNVYPGIHDQYFQDRMDELQLTDVEKTDTVEFVYLITNSIYSKRDFNVMLPKYAETLRIDVNRLDVDKVGNCRLLY